MKLTTALLLLSAASTQAGPNKNLRALSNADEENAIPQEYDAPLDFMSERDLGRMPIVPKPRIQIDKTVKLGKSAVCSLETESGWGELLVGPLNYDITYCYKVTNTGTMPLCSVKVTDAAGSGYNANFGCIAPGKAVYGPEHRSKIPSEMEKTMAEVTGTPSDENDDPTGAADVSDKDDAAVESKTTGVTIAKTVTKGWEGTCQGYGSSEKEHEILFGMEGDHVTYCYYVTNTGTVDLCSTIVSDDDMEYVQMIGCLKPGQSKYAPERRGTIPPDGEYVYGKVDAYPFTDVGIPITTFPHVTASDGAGVAVYSGGVKIETTIKKGIATCSDSTVAQGMDSFTAEPGDIFTYCYEVSNTGPTKLCNIVVFDEAGQYSETLSGCLEPYYTIFAPANPSYVCEPGDEKNQATVSATPSANDGSAIEELDDVSGTCTADLIFQQCELKPKVLDFKKAKVTCEPSPGWPEFGDKAPMRPSKCMPKAKR